MAEKKERKMVTIHLFRDNGKYSRDFTTYGDNKIWKIKRGVDVEVPDFIAEKVEKSLRRQNELGEMIYRNTREGEKI